MKGHLVILRDDVSRARAKRIIDAAPVGSTVQVDGPRRTIPQNKRFHAMLSDVSMAKPGGRVMTPERWKAAIMQSFGHAVQFENDLDGRPFPIGHSSSKLTKAQMGELMEFMTAHFTPLGVRWSDGE